MRLIVTYLIAATLCGGYIKGLNEFMPEVFQMGPFEITWRAAVWPYSVGQIIAGWQMGGVDLEEPTVETEEKYEVPTVGPCLAGDTLSV